MIARTLQGMAPYPGQARCLALGFWPEWQAAQVVGGISGASEPPELPDEEADAVEPDGNAW